MKKIVFVFLILIVFGGLKASAQENMNVVEVDTTNINIPLPSNEFYEIGENLRETLKSFVQSFDKLLCFYFDSSDYKISIYKDIDSIILNKYIHIESPPQSERNDLREERILKFNNTILKSNIAAIKHEIDSINKIIEDTKLIVSYDDYNSIGTDGYLYQIKDAGGKYVYEIVNKYSKNYKSLSTINAIIVKKKLLYFEVYCEYKDVESIKWITEISESWAKAILNAN